MGEKRVVTWGKKSCDMGEKRVVTWGKKEL